MRGAKSYEDMLHLMYIFVKRHDRINKEVDVTVLGLVGGAPGRETPRVADSSAAGAGRSFHNSVPPSKQNRLGKPLRTMCKGGHVWARPRAPREARRRARPTPYPGVAATRGGLRPLFSGYFRAPRLLAARRRLVINEGEAVPPRGPYIH